MIGQEEVTRLEMVMEYCQAKIMITFIYPHARIQVLYRPVCKAVTLKSKCTYLFLFFEAQYKHSLDFHQFAGLFCFYI